MKGGDAGIESVEKCKLVEEAHARNSVTGCVIPPQYDACHPVYALPPVLLTGLAETGALCPYTTPGVYQRNNFFCNILF